MADIVIDLIRYAATKISLAEEGDNRNEGKPDEDRDRDQNLTQIKLMPDLIDDGADYIGRGGRRNPGNDPRAQCQHTGTGMASQIGSQPMDIGCGGHW